MNTKIGNIVKKQLQNTAIMKEVPEQVLQQQNTINSAVDSVLTGFSSVAKDSDGRQRLYNAVNLADAVKLANKDSSAKDSGAQLNIIVGDEGEQRLVKKLCTGSDLTELQAKNVLAGVSPVVLNALKAELTHGTAENSAAGLATLLSSTGTATAVSKTPVATATHANAQPGHHAAHTTGGVAAAESGNSGFMRFALPLLLFGALILGSVKYCSESEKSRVVAEERGNLQLELNSAQEESELQTAEIASLQGDYDSAQTQIGQLQDELQSSRADVEALRDVPTDTAELQQKLASVTSDRDTAIADNRESIATIDSLKEEIEEISASRDDAIERNLQRTAANEKLQQQLDAAAPAIKDLESQVESLTSTRAELDQQLEETSQALTETRTARQQDTERLTAETTDLSGQLTQMLGFRNAAEASLKKQEMKVADQAGTITALEEQLDTLETANKEADQSAMLLQKRIDELNIELKSAEDSIATGNIQLTERTETLASTSDKLKAALTEVDDLQKERDGLSDTQQELTQNIEALNAEKNTAMEEIESLGVKISRLTDDLQTAMSNGEAKDARISELESSLESERTTVTGLENSNTTLEQEKSTLQADIETASGKIDALDTQLSMQGRKLLQERKTVAALNATAAGVKADAQALTDETLTLRENIEQQLIQAGINDAAVKSIDDDRAVAITLGSGNLFQTGEASLTREGGIVLAKVGNILTGYSSWHIDVEGHTDSFAIGKALRKRYPTNWELSSARAAAAVRHMKNVGGVNAESLSVHGFAETKPVADNSTAKGREQNRRVDIILRR